MSNLRVGIIATLVLLLWMLSLTTTRISIDKVRKTNGMKQTAISLGYAEYNQTNGVWQWKTNRLDN